MSSGKSTDLSGSKAGCRGRTGCTGCTSYWGAQGAQGWVHRVVSTRGRRHHRAPLAARRLGRSLGGPSAALQPCGTWRAQPWGAAQPLSRQCRGSRRRRELLRSLRLAKWRRAGLRRRQDGASDEAGALEDTARHGVDRLDEVGGRADGTRLDLRLGCQGVRCGDVAGCGAPCPCPYGRLAQMCRQRVNRVC